MMMTRYNPDPGRRYRHIVLRTRPATSAMGARIAARGARAPQIPKRKFSTQSGDRGALGATKTTTRVRRVLAMCEPLSVCNLGRNRGWLDPPDPKN